MSDHRRALTALLCGMLLVFVSACIPRRSGPSRDHRPPPPPPPCYADGVFWVQAQRTYSSGSVCSLDDLRQLSKELTIQRTGFNTVHVHQQGQYAHQANLDPYACSVWTDRTPTHRRQVFGSTFSGHAAYRTHIRYDGTLSGTLQLYVYSNTPFVPGCTASFNLAGRRVR